SRQDHQAWGLYGRQDLLEHAGALALMGTAARELEKIGHVPDQAFPHGDFFGGPPQAPLQLSEPQLVSHEVRAARLENAPSLFRDTRGEKLEKRRFSHLQLAGDQ